MKSVTRAMALVGISNFVQSILPQRLNEHAQERVLAPKAVVTVDESVKFAGITDNKGASRLAGTAI